eukprot:2966809-Ditylum_brightwellii.AAC.1
MFDEKAKKIEKAGSVHLPPDFLQQLGERLAKVDAYSENEKGGCDTDFPSLIGCECIMLRHLSFKQEEGKNKGEDEAMN